MFPELEEKWMMEVTNFEVFRFLILVLEKNKTDLLFSSGSYDDNTSDNSIEYLIATKIAKKNEE